MDFSIFLEGQIIFRSSQLKFGAYSIWVRVSIFILYLLNSESLLIKLKYRILIAIVVFRQIVVF